MSHDAASGMLKPNIIINPYAKTQEGNLTQQLNCGARALDLRVQLKGNDSLVFHHGKVVVDYKVREAMSEVREWLRTNPLEFVVLSWTCRSNSQRCFEILNQTLLNVSLPYLYQDCMELNKLSVSEAIRI